MFVPRFVGSIRLRLAVSLLCSLSSQMLWWASPAQAQGLLQIFGFSGPQVQTSRRALPPRQSLGGGHLQFGGTQSFWSPVPTRSEREWVDVSRSGGREGSGSYTTVCVRMCDGYYFPISHRAPRSRFYTDADVCRARCGGSEAQLFYYPSSGGDMKSAVDLTGRAYTRLPIAFLHRKKIVQGCGCRPEPWSAASRVRHEGYAVAEGRTPRDEQGGVGQVTIVAGNYPGSSSSVQPEAPASANERGASEAAANIELSPPNASDRSKAGEDGAETAPGRDDGASAAAQPAELEAPPRRKSKSRTARSNAGSSANRWAVRNGNAKAGYLVSAGSPSSRLVWPGDAQTRTR